jgi:hypothetical protein
MADYLPAPSFNLTYNTPLTDIGKGYAEGITKAGESIGGAITGIMGGVNPKTGEVTEGIFGQQRKADDTLAAMHQAGMLTKEQYDAVAGKGLGAKQQMVGLFATNWVNEQANQRALALEQGKGNVEINVAHAKLLDTINAVKSGYGAAVGVKPGAQPVQPQQQQQNAPRALPATLGSGSPVVTGTGSTVVPSVASQTEIKMGPPIGAKDAIPQGAKVGKVGNSPLGVLMPDGTFRPFQ